jgi:asparagine synthetase B (glutamine-hydrolysing)
LAGIFGYYSQNVNKNILNDMIRAMKDEDYCITESILDYSCVLGELDIKSTKVKELITKKEDKLSIVTCGEVYNEDIENLDKSILALYEEGRLDLLKNLNGSFAAAIYDGAEEKLTLVNDRYGLIKLFYYHDKDRFCFAPKIRPLLRLGAKKSLRKDAIIDFFLFGYLLVDKTFFEHIRQLPPASILEVSKNGMNLVKYWDYEYVEHYDARPQEELIDELGTLWQRAVERRIKKDETIIIPLSGGLDSRAILAAVLRCTSKDNIITSTFGEQGSFDFEIGKMVAEKAGVKNIPVGVEKADFERKYNTSLTDVEGMIDVTPYFPIEGYKYMKKYGSKLPTGYMGG